jgi:RNA polymerase sigma factor (sigma-70 family)
VGRKTKIEEEELIQLLLNRDRRGIEILYDNYSSALYGVILRIVRNDEVAEDLLQEAFLRIWNNSGQYDSAKGRLFTWMVNVCRNLAIDKVRSKDFINQNKNQTLLNAVSIADTGNSYDPELIGVREIVKKLEPEYRQIIDLLYFEGFTQSEAADKLNIPLGTVKTRSRAAMQRLRDHFDSTK